MTNKINLQEKLRRIISEIELLNEEEITTLVHKSKVDRYKKGTLLLKAGQVPTKCYMVVEGCVREYIIKDGVEKSTDFYLQGDTFTPRSEKGEPSIHYWECTEDSILTVSDKDFEKEIQQAIPRLDKVFQAIAIEKINQAKEAWTQFITSSPEERYLHLLETKPDLLIKVPQHQIASYLGIKPQSLSRIRKRLANKNYRSQ